MSTCDDTNALPEYVLSSKIDARRKRPGEASIRRDPLLATIVAAAVVLAIGFGLLAATWGPGPVLAEMPFVAPAMATYTALAAASLAFHSFGRFRALDSPSAFWTGLAFAGLAASHAFYTLTWPGLLEPEGGAILGTLPNTPAWIYALAAFQAATLLPMASLVSWPHLGLPPRRRWWLLFGWLALVALVGALSVRFETSLPLLEDGSRSTSTARFAAAALLVAFSGGAWLSARRYRKTGDTLLGYVAIFQLAVAVAVAASFLGRQRYDLWWYLSRLVAAGGLTAAVFGLLDEHAGIYRRERQRSEALRQSEQRFRELADAMPQLVWTARPDGAVDYYNRRYLEFEGIAPTDETWVWAPVLHPEDVESTVQAWQHAVATGTVYEIEHRVRQADGSYRWHLSRGVPARDAEGRITRWYGTATDIHETKHAEQALRESQERLAAEAQALSDLHGAAGRMIAAPDERAALAELLDAVMRVQRADLGSVQVLNAATATLDVVAQRGFSPDLLAPYMSLDASDDETICGRATRLGEPLVIEDVMRDPGYASHRDLAVAVGSRGVQSTPLITRTGEVLGIVSTHFRKPHRPSQAELQLTNLHTRFAAEVIERKRAQEAQRESEKQLRELNEGLERRVGERTAQLRALAAELAVAEERERRRLARYLHDELQQMLAAVSFHLESMRQRDLATSGRSELDGPIDMLREAIRSSRSLTAELSPTILYDAGLAAALHWLGRRMEEMYGLRVAVQAAESPGLPPLAKDIQMLLFQSARELLFNVVKHAGVHEAIATLARPTAESAVVAVSDSGRGFDPRQIRGQERITGGFGLLSIQERIAHIGGQVEIDSAPGHGVRIRLIVPVEPLPWADRDGSAPLVEAPPSDDAPRKTYEGGALSDVIRIVVADDHAITRKGLLLLLEDHADMVVVGEASDGREAIQLASTLHPDVILMDVAMPRMDGIEATRRITAELPDARVIGLSMYNDPEQEARMRQAGARAYIPKEGPPDALLAAIRGQDAQCLRTAV